MNKFIPFEKLSKKKQRELNAIGRGSWGAINPVTRRPEKPKAYNRKKAQKWIDDSSSVPFAMKVKLYLYLKNKLLLVFLTRLACFTKKY